jgi:hypothetical protein
MNYSECLIQLINVCPLKDIATDNKRDWHLASIDRDNIIALFDSEILTMANIAVFNVELTTDYMLIVGSRFGTMIVPDNKNAEQAVRSYYLKTGILYGPSSKKKRQFAFEISALANKNGVSFSNDIGVRDSKGETGLVFSAVEKILKEYFSK